MNNKTAEQKVLDGSVWEEFCDAIKEAGKIIDSDKAPKDVFNRAEGYRYLSRLLRANLESMLEFADKDFPVLRCGCHETIKLGADNPDNYYQSAPINPLFEYRIVGPRNTVPYLSFSAVNNQYSKGEGITVEDFIDVDDIDLDEDGNIEIILSQKSYPDRNSLKMLPSTNQILVRQTFKDRVNEKRADIRIDRLNAEGETPEPLTAEKLVYGLEGASRSLKNIPQIFENWSESMLETKNELPQGDQAFFRMLGGDPNIHYFHSYWALEKDEVLLIEAPVPECDTWNFQLDNWWMESLDYVNHTIHKNKFTASYEADGSVKIVVSHIDPGHPNWIDTAGHVNGTMCWRWIGAQDKPDLKTSVLKLADFTAR